VVADTVCRQVGRELRLITCCIQYTLDPRQVGAFEKYASRWPPIIERCGGDLVGYYLPKEGANNYALALIDFASLADYEPYRQRLAADPDAQQNLADAEESGCILAETRSFLRRAWDGSACRSQG